MLSQACQTPRTRKTCLNMAVHQEIFKNSEKHQQSNNLQVQIGKHFRQYNLRHEDYKNLSEARIR
jgi:hypothetical protein